MSGIQIVLRATAVAMIGAGALHSVLGLGAERVLDPSIPPEVQRLASLDSQNRFYGVMFGTTGALLWICVRDCERYDAILRRLLWGLCAGGTARLASIVVIGWPSPVVAALLLTEIVGAPILLMWLSATRRAN